MKMRNSKKTKGNAIISVSITTNGFPVEIWIFSRMEECIYENIFFLHYFTILLYLLSLVLYYLMADYSHMRQLFSYNECSCTWMRRVDHFVGWFPFVNFKFCINLFLKCLTGYKLYTHILYKYIYVTSSMVMLVYCNVAIYKTMTKIAPVAKCRARWKMTKHKNCCRLRKYFGLAIKQYGRYRLCQNQLQLQLLHWFSLLCQY